MAGLAEQPTEQLNASSKKFINFNRNIKIFHCRSTKFYFSTATMHTTQFVR